MITAERLEELIKQGALIYLVSSIDNEVYSMQLNSYLTINSRCLVYEGGYWYKLDLLFETKEQAEWALKTTAERTERFDPPMWEDIENEWNFYFAKGKEIYHFWVEKDCVGISKCEYLCDYWSDAHKTLFEEEATKENYIKACKIVRDLFNKGGAK